MKNLKAIFGLIGAIGILVFSSGCEDEYKDFTSGSFYPFEPVDTTEMPTDTTIIIDEDPCWDENINVSFAADFNATFTSYSGWTGGDATYSIPLPDGRILWIFGDSFIGTVHPDRSRPATPLVRNAFVIQDENGLTNLQGEEDAFLSPEEESWWYWPGDGITFGDTLQVVMFGFKAFGTGMWDFGYASVDIATFLIPEMELLSIDRKMVDPKVNFGASLLYKDEYTYIYGSEKAGLSKFLHTARVKGHNLNSTWEYWNGTTWTTEISESINHFAHVSDQFCVFEHEDGFYLLTQHHILGGEIYIYKSDNPVNGFENQQVVYCTPQSNIGNLFTYNAFAHTQFLENGKLLVSYNVNSQNFADLFSNADNYRPYFVWVDGWK